jgi:subtilisin family serine protease
MVNSGTSFSSPILAGMTACLWQAAPSWSSQLITRSIELSGNQVSNPDSLLGYGIPDFIKALQHVGVDKKEVENLLQVYPNPFTNGFTVSFNSGTPQEYYAVLYNNLGQAVYSIQGKADRAGGHEMVIPDMAFLPNGNYILKVVGKNFLLTSKVIKINN